MTKKPGLTHLDAVGVLVGAALALASIAQWSTAAAGLVAGIALVTASLLGRRMTP